MEIDWWTFGAQIINIIILLFLLRKFLYIPVLKAVEARQKLISDELNTAEKTRIEAQSLMQECENRLSEIEEQKQEILLKANAEAENFAADLMRQAQEKYQFAVDAWHNKILDKQDLFAAAMQNLIAEYFTKFADTALTQMADVHLSDLVVAKFMEKLTDKTTDLAKTFSKQSYFVVQTAQPLSKNDLQKIKKLLQEKIGVTTDIRFEVTENPALICGIVIEAGGKQVSWHLADYMQQFKETMQQEMSQLLKRS